MNPDGKSNFDMKGIQVNMGTKNLHKIFKGWFQYCELFLANLALKVKKKVLVWQFAFRYINKILIWRHLKDVKKYHKKLPSKGEEKLFHLCKRFWLLTVCDFVFLTDIISM
jgi:hypothetical protein